MCFQVVLAYEVIVLCKCSGKHIDIYFKLKITFLYTCLSTKITNKFESSNIKFHVYVKKLGNWGGQKYVGVQDRALVLSCYNPKGRLKMVWDLPFMASQITCMKIKKNSALTVTLTINILVRPNNAYVGLNA